MGAPTDGQRADFEFWAPRRTAYLAEPDPQAAATSAPPSTTAEPDRVLAGRNADPAVDGHQQSPGGQRVAHSAWVGKGRDGPQEVGATGRGAVAVHGGATGRSVDGKSAARARAEVGLAPPATAVDRGANGAAQQQDRGSHEAASRRRDSTGGSAWLGSGFCATNPRGDGRSGQYVPSSSGVNVVGGTCPGKDERAETIAVAPRKAINTCAGC